MPSAPTVATDGSREPQTTALFVAFAGDTVAESLTEEPTDTVREPDTDTIDTGTVTEPPPLTTTVADADFPFDETAVTVAPPAFKAFTTPSDDTLATDGSELDHDTDLSDALPGDTTADNCREPPTDNDTDDGDTDTEDTGTGTGLHVTADSDEDTGTGTGLHVTADSDVSPTFQPIVPPA